MTGRICSTYLPITSSPLMCAPASCATALAIMVFPTPGGPYNSTPLGILIVISSTYLPITSGPLTIMTCAPASCATALAIMVFPTPGGPYNSTPLGGVTPAKNHWTKYTYMKYKLISKRLNMHCTG